MTAEEARDALIEEFKDRDGFEGCGLGKDGLVVCVCTDEMAQSIPPVYHGFSVEVIQTGGITYFSCLPQ